MQTPPLVVVGTSAGGIDALREVVAGLPAGFPAPSRSACPCRRSPGVVHEILWSRSRRLRLSWSD